MGNYREVWVEANGPIPKGMHIHHILPQYLGGTDELDNLQIVTPEEHYDIHLERGEHGACSLLSDGIDREAPKTPVRQYDLNGYFIQEFESFSEASVNTGNHTLKIFNCCNYNQKSSLGYQWFYTSEVGDSDFVGLVERTKAQVRGNDSSKKYYLNVHTKEVFGSQRQVHRKLGRTKSTWGKIPEEYIEITKEEYEKLCV